jgi:hypothetical protein
LLERIFVESSIILALLKRMKRLKNAEAKKIVQVNLSCKIFYSIDVHNQKVLEQTIQILNDSTESFLQSTSSANFDLLRSTGLFKAVNQIFLASHCQGHLAGRAGVVSHGELGRREKRLLALIQRWTRRTELSQELIECGFIENIITRIQSMSASLQNFGSSQCQDEVIEESISSSDEDDDMQQELTSSYLPPVISINAKKKNVVDHEPDEFRTFEFTQIFETSKPIGIRLVDRAAAIKNLNKKKKKKIKKKKNKKINDSDLGLYVGSLVDFGQADQLNRLHFTIHKKHLDNEIYEGDKIIAVNDVDVSQCTGNEFVAVMKRKGANGKKPVRLKFRGERVIKRSKSPKLKLKIPSAPPIPKTNNEKKIGRKGRRRLVHKKGSLGGGKSEKGGRIRNYDMTIQASADAALMSAIIRPATSLKAKGLAATFTSNSMKNRKLIVKGDDLINRISYHLNVLIRLLDNKIVKNYIIKSKQNSLLVNSLLTSINDILRTFEFFKHSMEQFLIGPLIQIIYNLSEKKNRQNTVLKSWEGSANDSYIDHDKDGSWTNTFISLFMEKKKLWLLWINCIYRYHNIGSKQSNSEYRMSAENLHMMMTMFFSILTKGKLSKQYIQQVGVYWVVTIGIDIVNYHRSYLLGLDKIRQCNMNDSLRDWGGNKKLVSKEKLNIQTFQLIVNSCIKCFEDDTIRMLLFQSYYKKPGLSSIWLALFDTIFDVDCCEMMLKFIHVLFINKNTGQLRMNNYTYNYNIDDVQLEEQTNFLKPPEKAMIILEMCILGKDVINEDGVTIIPQKDFIAPLLTDRQKFERNRKVKTISNKVKVKSPQRLIIDKEEETKKNITREKKILLNQTYTQTFTGPINLQLSAWNKKTNIGVFVSNVNSKTKGNIQSINKNIKSIQPGDLIIGIGDRRKGSSIRGHINVRNTPLRQVERMLADMKRPISVQFQRTGCYAIFHHEKTTETNESAPYLLDGNSYFGFVLKSMNNNNEKIGSNMIVIANEISPNTQASLYPISKGDQLIQLNEYNLLKNKDITLKDIIKILKDRSNPTVEVIFKKIDNDNNNEDKDKINKSKNYTNLKHDPNWKPKSEVWESVGIHTTTVGDEPSFIKLPTKRKHEPRFQGQRKESLKLDVGLFLALNLAKTITQSFSSKCSTFGSTSTNVGSRLLKMLLTYFQKEDGSLPKPNIASLLCWGINEIVEHNDIHVKLFSSGKFHRNQVLLCVERYHREIQNITNT